MKLYSLEEAQEILQQLFADAHQGKNIAIRGEDNRAVRLVPFHTPLKKPRQAGSAKGLIWMSEDFDDPIEDFAEYME